MTESNWTPIFCPKDEGTLRNVAIAADQRSAVAKCKECGRLWEIVTTGPPNVSWRLEELRVDL